MLTDTVIRNAKPADRPYRLFDAGGLYLEISPTGSKWSRLKYRVRGRDRVTGAEKRLEKRLSLGTFPDVSLKAARKRRDEARALLGEGIDPSANRKEKRREALGREINSFESIAREWHGKRSARWSAVHARNVLHRLEGRPLSRDRTAAHCGDNRASAARHRAQGRAPRRT